MSLSEALGRFLNGFRKGVTSSKVQEEIEQIDSLTTLNRQFLDHIAGYLISEDVSIEPSLVTKAYANVFTTNQVVVGRLRLLDSKKYRSAALLVADIGDAVANILVYRALAFRRDEHVETYLNYHQKLIDTISMVNFELLGILEDA